LKQQNFSKFQLRAAREHSFSKTKLLNNFLIVRPIFTSNTPIDLVKQGEQTESFEIFQNANLGEQGSNF
jgi:hypothetical protein